MKWWETQTSCGPGGVSMVTYQAPPHVCCVKPIRRYGNQHGVVEVGECACGKKYKRDARPFARWVAR